MKSTKNEDQKRFDGKGMETPAGNPSKQVNELVETLKEVNAFAGVGGTSSASFHGFVEDASFLTLAVSHLKDGKDG